MCMPKILQTESGPKQVLEYNLSYFMLILSSEIPVQAIIDMPGQKSCVAEFSVALGTSEGLCWLLFIFCWRVRS